MIKILHLLYLLLYSTCNRGAGGSLKSCNALLQRVEDNDPRLTELVILPMKTFGVADVERLSNAIGEIIDVMCAFVVMCVFLYAAA